LSKRQSFDVDGLHHEAPIPAVSRIGPFVMSSSISGVNPATGQLPASIEEQCAMMFGNIKLLIEAAGGTPEDILKVTVWLKDRSNRPIVNQGWVKMFPDPKSRPVRHTFANPDLPTGKLVECEFTAVL
jgi:enamine deaminase RidA (YjgF/YER057c/UK114 family)